MIIIYMPDRHSRNKWRDTSVYSCAHYGLDVLSSMDSIAKQVQSDEHGMKLELKQDKHLILNFLGEGHGPDEIKNLVIYLQKFLPLENIKVLFNSYTDSTPGYVYRCFTENMVNHYGYFDHIDQASGDPQLINLDHKFLSLNRRSSNIRTRLIDKLSNKISIRYSLNSNESPHTGKVLLDGLIDQEKQKNNSDIIFRTCLFNIINESSDQSTPNLYRSIFLTEKTFKAFALRQIPIWMAVPGLVDKVRNLGFDLFDDLCQNHYYDNTIFEDLRCQQVAEMCLSLDKKFTVEQCQQIRSGIWHRLENNYKLLKKYIGLHQQTLNNHFDFLNQ